jgi:ATP-binding cassette, subfamily B, bacterial MsbA
LQPDPVEPSKKLLRRFWRAYLRPHMGLILIAFILMAIEGSTLGLLSYMIQPLFDQVFATGGQEALFWVGGAILGLFLVRAFTSVVGKWLLARVNQTAAAQMQADLVDHLLKLDGSFFQVNSPGTLIEQVQGDTVRAQGAATTVIMGVGRDVVALLGLFVVAVNIDPIWTLAALVGTPLLLIPAIGLRRYIFRKTMTSRQQSGLRATRLDEIFHGIQSVKLNRMEAYQSHRFQRILSIIVRAEEKAAIGRATLPGLVDVVTGIGFFAVLMLGGREVAEGTRTTGEFMAFFTAMALTFQPIRRLGELAGLWQVAEASLQRVYALLDARPSDTRPKISRALPAPGAPEIRFEDVTFAYPDRPVLRALSFVAEAGRVTAIVGSSGAGKTTIFQLISAMVEPQSGRVLIGGVDVQDMSLSDQRGLLSSVSQDAALFDETLRENLLLGRKGLEEARIARVLADAEATDFIGDLPTGARNSGRSAGQCAFRRPAAADRDCPRAFGRCAGSAAGRGDLGAGHPDRGRRFRGTGQGANRTHDPCDRAPAVYGQAGGQDHRP